MGLGTEKNYIKAYKLLSQAALKGNENAKIALSKLIPMMTPEQIDEAKKIN
jgi:TPR repeat protein